MPVPSRAELAAYALLLVLAAVVGVRYLRAQGGAGEPGRAAARAAPSPPSATVRRAEDVVVVHVAGAVRRPGVFRLRRGARVRDAVARAGGASGRADVHAVNLAARVEDAQQVVVPARTPATTRGPGTGAGSGTASATGTTAPPAPVRLGTATFEQLDALDGVGPALAQRILDARTERGGFSRLEDLAEVPGIGPKRLEALREAVTP